VRDEAHLAEPLTAERLIAQMDAAGVDAAVIVPPSWEGDRNDYALDAARRYPARFAVMGRVPVARPEARAALERWTEQPGMRGVRLTLHPVREGHWLRDGTLDWFWPAAERLAIPVMVNGRDYLPELGSIAERHPGLRLILDHLGLGKADIDGGVPAGVARTIALAKWPNVSVKLSALPTFSSEPYPYRNLFAPLRRTIDAFGPQRCYWGSDLSRLPGTYREAVTMFTEALDFLSRDDLEAIMGRALAGVLGWPLPQAPASDGQK
jgi:predicted TIM-barrel fold metal-dependent hydrolase